MGRVVNHCHFDLVSIVLFLHALSNMGDHVVEDREQLGWGVRFASDLPEQQGCRVFKDID